MGGREGGDEKRFVEDVEGKIDWYVSLYRVELESAWFGLMLLVGICVFSLPGHRNHP